MKISFICTVFNEDETIDVFLDSVFAQTRPADEVIIVDGGSTDSTVVKIKKMFASHKGNQLRILQKKGNRSVGRNEAIRAATNNIIAISDAGCILDKQWLKEISKPFENKKVDVVAGYYRGKANTVFQKCLVPYALVMEDQVNPDTFLPATRSMALRKSVWEKTGGFPEAYSHNEDYVFANKIKKDGYTIVFQKSAVVSWIPRNSLRSAFWMFLRFAYGDGMSGLRRKKVLSIYLRYIIAIGLLAGCIILKSYELTVLLVVLICVYIGWAVLKNYKYVKNIKAGYLLPIIQILSDWAIMIGSLAGYLKRAS